MDIGLIATGLAAGIAFGWGRGKWLRNLLMFSWALVAMQSIMGGSMSSIVFTLTAMDLVIAGAATAVVTNNPVRYDARVVGQISMALMPVHWVMAWSEGAIDWTTYASVCNFAFIIQCLIVRGWLDGLGRGILHFFTRLHPVHLFRHGERQ